MRYLSLFSGIEACTVAWHPLGWEPVAFAEFDDFPKAVLHHHYPDVPDLGDVTKITEERIKALGHIDLLVGGSPCQDLSVAGKRAGLRDEWGNVTRSGLFGEQMRIFEIARKHNGCRWMLWENVPGAFSSNDGQDFRYILESMVQGEVPFPADGWGTGGVCVSRSGHRLVEWRVLDAQYMGVAQRRRRVFALLDTGAWWSRPPVLFESEGLSGDFETGRITRQGSAGGTEERSQEDSCVGWNARDIRGSRVTENSMDPLGASQYKGAPLVGYRDSDLFFSTGNQGKETISTGDEPSGTITARVDCGFLAERATCITSGDFSNNGDDVSPTLMSRDYKDPNIVGYETAVTFQTGHTKGNCDGVNEGDVSYTLSRANDQAVAYRVDPESSNSMKSSNPNSGFHEEDVCCTLDTSSQNPVRNQGGMMIMERDLFDA